ncbi:MAG: tRNA-guanine transglycosylase [Verrucomicrobiales bacterium]|nr:tRNA-guanine transglycosylase [Verrucomicrobiales bacterium]MDB6129044.1 tRNA-guanine transglycosylase [Verrucomicrobiales bacterium]
MQTEADYKLVRLVNGTWSVHSTPQEETFHPVVGPIAEAESLYVKQLDLIARATHSKKFVIWDIGLGAGANVLTALKHLRTAPAAVQIVSFDHTLAALSFALKNSSELEFVIGFEEPIRELMAKNRVAFDNGLSRVEWTYEPGDFPALIKSEYSQILPQPDAIFFDAFSPAKNPAMWSLELFQDLHSRVKGGRPCNLSTYSRATIVRVTLLLAGFYVGSGQATGEKEETTIASTDATLVPRLLPPDWLKRVKSSRSAEPLHSTAYVQRPITEQSWTKLLQHPQFNG